MLGWLTVCFVSIVLGEDNVSAAVAGPYKIDVRQVGPCLVEEVGDVGTDFLVEGRVHNDRNKGSVFTGNVSVYNDLFGIGASTLTFDMAKWDTVSGWRTHFLVMPFGELCFALTDVFKSTFDFMRSQMPELPERCPVPNRQYTVEKLVMRLLHMAHFPVLPYGRFRVHGLTYYRQRPEVKQPRGCVRVIVDVTPRVKNG